MMDRFTNSDHLPQVFNISPELSIMTWNILKRCTFYEQPRKFYNNGFGIVESEYDYHLRLKKLTKDLYNTIINDTTIKCIALQEVPTELDLAVFQNHLKDLLPTFKLLTYKTQGFLFDKDTVVVEDKTGKLLGKIGKNLHKIQSIRAQIDNREINFINVHLCWFKSFNSRLDVINKILAQIKNRTIILGDFNFNILDLEIEGVTNSATPNTTLVYMEDGVQNLETCDGFIIV